MQMQRVFVHILGAPACSDDHGDGTADRAYVRGACVSLHIWLMWTASSTGGSRGIGLSIALKLAQAERANVCIAAKTWVASHASTLSNEKLRVFVQSRAASQAARDDLHSGRSDRASWRLGAATCRRRPQRGQCAVSNRAGQEALWRARCRREQCVCHCSHRLAEDVDQVGTSPTLPASSRAS